MQRRIDKIYNESCENFPFFQELHHFSVIISLPIILLFIFLMKK